jgi:hypothetical protein
MSESVHVPFVFMLCAVCVCSVSSEGRNPFQTPNVQFCRSERLSWHTGVRTTYRSSFFIFSWAGVRLSPLGTSATNWPIVPAPGDRWWVWNSRWNENWQGKPKYSETTYPSATLSTTNPTWLDLGSNPGRRSGKLATNPLSYGTAYL